MKKLILLFALAIGMVATAQDVVVDSTSAKSVTFYTSVGLSMSNTADGDFKTASYPSIEAGINKGNLSFGLAVGRGNLANFENDVIQNYWFEGKTYLNHSIGDNTIFMVLGLGNYVDTSKIFIEYGAGISTPLCSKVSFTAQATNWDSIWYVTPGLQYTF